MQRCYNKLIRCNNNEIALLYVFSAFFLVAHGVQYKLLNISRSFLEPVCVSLEYNICYTLEL